jgi:hypothetical protein
VKLSNTWTTLIVPIDCALSEPRWDQRIAWQPRPGDLVRDIARNAKTLGIVISAERSNNIAERVQVLWTQRTFSDDISAFIRDMCASFKIPPSYMGFAPGE